MFRWYRNAADCYMYLANVVVAGEGKGRGRKEKKAKGKELNEKGDGAEERLDVTRASRVFAWTF